MSEQETPEAFRQRARAWVEQNLPRAEHLGDNFEADDEQKLQGVAEDRELQRKIFDAGFAGIRYPVQYGGQGLTRAHQLAWYQATAGYRVPSAFRVTHGILGPTLVDFGTEEQKAAHLPAMLDGSELWVQFLSEPSGGSDLAGLLTRADRDGDLFRLNGSKIWSTGAHFCDWAMILARTNVDVPKHAGLSMFLLPVRSPGVTVTPIKLVTGGSHFCQEFFDDVQLTPDQLVGPENDGWRVASKMLFHERNMLGGNSLNDDESFGVDDASGDTLTDLIAAAKAVGRSDDSYTRQLIGEAVILETLTKPTTSRINASLRTGRLPESAASILRLMAGLQGFRLREIAMEIAGTQGVLHGADDPVGSYGLRWLSARISTVGGGSQEMQRNGISERVLGLPREATPDRGVPFSEVLASRRSQPG